MCGGMFALGSAVRRPSGGGLAAVRKLRWRARLAPSEHGEIRSRAARLLRAIRDLSETFGRGAWGGPAGMNFTAPGTERDDDRKLLRPDHLQPLNHAAGQRRLSAFAASATALFNRAGRSSGPLRLTRSTASPFSTESVEVRSFPVR